MGMVTSLGTGVERNWHAVTSGHSGIGPIRAFDPVDLDTRIAGEVGDDFDPDHRVPGKELRRMGRFQQFLMVAAGEAADQSGLSFPPENPFGFGVVIGSGVGGIEIIEQGLPATLEKGPRAVHPLYILRLIINFAAATLAIKYGLRGPDFAVASGCTSGASAIGEAYRIIKQGRAEVMFAGGADACVTKFGVSAFNALGVLSTRNGDPGKASCPFDADRDGFVISEGAGLLILESEEHARRRAATTLAEIVGYGATHDAYSETEPDPKGEGAYRCMKKALDLGGLEPSQIGYINAHAPSSPLSDQTEAAAIARLFAESAQKPAVSSTKSMTGHLLGAGGAVEAIYTAMALRTGIIPPTINLENPAPPYELDYITNHAVRRDIEYALSNSFALGGQNACLAFKRVRPA
jgi:3-oxoacyl-[acyl-carrier-protein] synthase II